jgi:hypothetical protein
MSEVASFALRTADGLNYLSVAWHNKLSTEELHWMSVLSKRLQVIAEDEHLKTLNSGGEDRDETTTSPEGDK